MILSSRTIGNYNITMQQLLQMSKDNIIQHITKHLLIFKNIVLYDGIKDILGTFEHSRQSDTHDTLFNTLVRVGVA